MVVAAIAATILGAAPIRATLMVFAAASLKEPFTAISKAFESVNPSIKVRLNFAGSNTLAAQINNGAPADVFASAAAKNLDACKFERSTRRVFAHNRLRVALRKGSTGIRTLVDLPKVGRLVVADQAVPVGAYTQAFLAKATAKFGESWGQRVRSRIASKEPDVKAVLAKVVVGEADAGIVYVSDVFSARGKVGSLDLPTSLSQPIDYPVAVLASAPNPKAGRAFIEFLMEKASQDLLAQHGLIRARQG